MAPSSQGLEPPQKTGRFKLVVCSSWEIIQQEKNLSIYHIANELNIDLEGKIKFIESEDGKKETFLFNQISYLLQILQQAEKSKDVFHLN